MEVTKSKYDEKSLALVPPVLREFYREYTAANFPLGEVYSIEGAVVDSREEPLYRDKKISCRRIVMVKKIIVILVTCILAGSLLSGCSNQEETTLFVGEYEIEETTAIIPPYVKIEKDNRFVFQYSTFSSYLPMGNYTLDNNVLTLVTDDQKYHYVFHISDDKLIFQEEQSSSLTVYADEPNIVNGAVFTYRRDN